MSGRLGARAGMVLVTMLLFSFYALANFVPKEQRLNNPVLPDQGLRLGLDLQGGIHWVLSVDLEVRVKHELGILGDRLESVLEDDGLKLDSIAVENEQLIVETGGETVEEAVEQWASDTGVLVNLSSAPLTYELTSRWRDEVRENAMAQVLEVLRKRIADPLQGIPDSVVARQGDNRVLVQIPGGQIDRSSARNLLNSTGFLEFKIVQDSEPTEDLLLAKYNGELPEGTTLAFERDRESGRVINAYLVPVKAAITGAFLKDANMNFDNMNRPVVNFTWNTEGGEIFQELTAANIGEPLGIILDDNVYSAPNIQSVIGLRGQITGRFSQQEAADLAVVLRSGSLSVPVIIEEERTVGPSLGADSIEQGVNASMLGLVLIVCFAVAYYRVSGIYASIALLANLLLLIGTMSMFGATLTLPGLAGIVLTIGMAVDANVIIFERIREELRSSKTPRAAIATGFNRARTTILDANITTLFTALVLFQFGTGPIKGFALTLSIGVLTSVFAALVITRLLFDLYPGTRHVESLSI